MLSHPSSINGTIFNSELRSDAEELGCENCGGGDDVEGAGEGDRGEVGLWGSW